MNKRRYLRFGSLLLLGSFVVLSVQATLADVRPHALFSDGMVLQRGMEIPVWGTADEGEQVEVAFCGQTVTTAARDGAWTVRLAPLDAGGPYTMTISGANSVEIRDVLVGEVWVCGGQSNMVQPVRNSVNGEQEVKNSAKPMIRLLKVASVTAEERMTDIDASWYQCGPDTVGAFSAVGYFFGREIQAELGTPVGLIQSCVGGTPAEAWMSKETLEAIPEGTEYIESYDNALEAYGAARAKLEAESNDPVQPATGRESQPGRSSGRKAPSLPRVPATPSGLYNGMIAPLQPYAIRGAIWYQGEANAGSPARARAYRVILPALINCWRSDWGQGDFPFLFVQLAAYRAQKGSDWPLLRESQAITLSVRNTGMAVAIDAGEETNIHPKYKQIVGHRLALAARAVAYGEDVPFLGPTYQGMETRGDSIVVSFAHADGGLVAKGEELKGFSIAASNREFVEASARIDGNKVVVSSLDVLQPVAVRYGWADYPDCNLYNGSDLPAVSFRTDEF